MPSKDPNYAIKVEKAIAEKYGEKAVQHPKKDWDDDKEAQYLSDIFTMFTKTMKIHKKK